MAEQKTCLIVGAGAGNGASLARKFGSQGYRVIVASRRAPEMERLAASLTASGINATARAIDAVHPANVHSSISALGPIDVLIYNAAGLTMSVPTALSPEQLSADLNVSVVSALAAARVVAPSMIAAGRGSILVTGGGFALRPMAAMTSLGIGKAAVRNLAFSLAEELSPKGIRVATVTILGMIKPGTPFDPDRIADVFWRLHEDRDGKLGVEVQFSGAETS